MKMQGLIAIGSIIAILHICSCTDNGGQKSRVPVYTGADIHTERSETYASTNQYSSYEEVSVPFRNERGVKLIDVKINGMGLEMIFDTGCSDALISVAEARYLYEKGTLTDCDFIGFAPSQIANGSIVNSQIVNLKEVVIGDKIHCYNVKAGISNNIEAPLLLGNGILDQVATYTIDNENKRINFKLK